jgi:outer membrane protein assembly factor BamB
MGIIPPVHLLFYVLPFLAFLLLLLTLIILLRGKRARRIKACFFACACLLQIATIAYPLYLYSNKPAPLAASDVLIGSRQGQIVALNARDGSVRWTQPIADNSTLFTAGTGNLLYVVSQMSNGTDSITAYAVSNDRQVWRSSLAQPQSHGKYEHLMASDGFVYIDEAMGISDEVVYALHASDGSFAWKHTEHIADQLEDATKPLLITAGNGLVFVRAQDSGFSALHASDGSLAWHFAPDIPQGGSVYAYQLIPTNQSVYYLQSTSGNQDVWLVAISQGNGKPLWQERMQGSNGYANRLVVAGTHLYLSINAQTILLNALNGTRLWQRSWMIDAKGMATEANGILYVPVASSLNAVDTHNGQILWSLPADPDGSFTMPVLYQNVLFASAQAIPPHGFFGTGASGQDAIVAINATNGSAYWSTTNAGNFVDIFHLS